MKSEREKARDEARELSDRQLRVALETARRLLRQAERAEDEGELAGLARELLRVLEAESASRARRDLGRL